MFMEVFLKNELRKKLESVKALEERVPFFGNGAGKKIKFSERNEVGTNTQMPKKNEFVSFCVPSWRKDH